MSRHLATLQELEEYYGVWDLLALREVAMVDMINDAIAHKPRK